MVLFSVHRSPGFFEIYRYIFDDLVQDCSISDALTMEIPQSCTKPSISWQWRVFVLYTIPPNMRIIHQMHLYKQRGNLSSCNLSLMMIIMHWFQILAYHGTGLTWTWTTVMKSYFAKTVWSTLCIAIDEYLPPFLELSILVNLFYVCSENF